MGRAKLPPDEARRRRFESARRSRQKPEVKQKIREAELKRRKTRQQTYNDNSPSSKRRRLDNESFADVSPVLRPGTQFVNIESAIFKETVVGFGKGLTRVVQYVALSCVTSTAGLYMLDNYTPPPPPHEDNSHSSRTEAFNMTKHCTEI
ncbi:hypothetical protein CEXT_105631 [Caerostris extrusa]|uniref:Uncharacterized protein n=1 Tax=Caerostris extrusa TaxID=172846 RepID=A0AAV4XJN0_CAEEX|nr:hypothetical protein CEXT_105631 [Caerostris extrusa]